MPQIEPEVALAELQKKVAEQKQNMTRFYELFPDLAPSDLAGMGVELFYDSVDRETKTPVEVLARYATLNDINKQLAYLLISKKMSGG